MTDHYDVIVIGSGAGGGTLTHALAPTGKRILLLERGDFMPREIENWDSKAVWLDKRYAKAGTWTDDATGKAFTPKQHYYVGGNTKVYEGIPFRFRERDFGEIQHVDGISSAWPISYPDLEPWYERAERLYQVHGERGTDPDRAARERAVPLPRHQPRAAHPDAVRQPGHIGLYPFPLPNGIVIDEAAPWRSACIRCATCDGYACLTNGKADAAVIAVEPVLHHPNVTLRTRALVTRLETDTSGRTVNRVVVERDGQQEAFSADVVVVAGGAINSAALLLRSASDRHPQGLGNGSGVVGRHLMMHNNSSLIAFSKVPNPTKFQKTLGINDFYFGDGDWPYPLWARCRCSARATLCSSGSTLPRPRTRLTWPGTRSTSGSRPRTCHGPTTGSRSTPAGTSACATHRRTWRRTLGCATGSPRSSTTSSCREEVLENYSYRGGRLGISGGRPPERHHPHFGTNPSTSALDLDCRLHDVDNVHVAASSFFVSSTAVNPTLTIIANAQRVAEGIAQRLGTTTLTAWPQVPRQSLPVVVTSSGSSAEG